MGAAVTLTAGWLLAITAGVAVGSIDSRSTVLAAAVPLCLAAVVAPQLRTGSGFVAVAAAVTVSFASASWPAGTGVLGAMGASALAGGLTAGRSR